MTLSTQNHAKPLEKLNYGFKRTINWNKYQSKKSREGRNQYFDYLIDPSFQGVNRLFVLSFEDKGQRLSHNRHYLLTVEIKNYVTIYGQKCFSQPVKINLTTYDSMQKIATGQGDDYTTGFLLD